MAKNFNKDFFDILYANCARAVYFNFAIVAVLVFNFWFHGANTMLTIKWAFFILFLNLIRLACLTRIYNKQYYRSNPKTSKAVVIAIATILGLAWSAGYFLFSADLQETETVLVVLMLGGVSAGALASMSAYLPSFFAFMFATLLPLTLQTFSYLTIDTFTMGCLYTLFMFMLSITAVHYNSIIKETVELKHKKDSLLEKLQISNEELQVAYKEIQKISNTDSLTSLANRRYFDEILEKEWRRANRMHTPLSLLLIDIDNFKNINDNLGHLMGDEYLKEIASKITLSLRRAPDFAARIGGDEFAIILPETTLANASLLAEKIRADIMALNHRYGKALELSISIGISSLVDDNRTIANLFSQADQALYKAKSHGKNQVAIQ